MARVGSRVKGFGESVADFLLPRKLTILVQAQEPTNREIEAIIPIFKCFAVGN